VGPYVFGWFSFGLSISVEAAYKNGEERPVP